MWDKANTEGKQKFSDVTETILIELEELFNFARLRMNLVGLWQFGRSNAKTSPRIVGEDGPLMSKQRIATLELPNPKIKRQFIPQIQPNRGEDVPTGLATPWNPSLPPGGQKEGPLWESDP